LILGESSAYFAQKMSAIEFHCVLCGEKMRAEPAFAGAVADCPACSRRVPVPGFPSGGSHGDCLPVYAAGILSLDVNFRCPACRANLVIDARWEGRSVDCPACKTPLTVPLWSRIPLSRSETKPSPATLSEAEIHFLSADPEIRFG
jgi:DNA-directed RNA polymerase subunit RPC12/RpoP